MKGRRVVSLKVDIPFTLRNMPSRGDGRLRVRAALNMKNAKASKMEGKA